MGDLQRGSGPWQPVPGQDQSSWHCHPSAACLAGVFRGAELGTNISFPQPAFPSQFAVCSAWIHPSAVPGYRAGGKLCPCSGQVVLGHLQGPFLHLCRSDLFRFPFFLPTWEGTEVKYLKRLVFVKAKIFFDTKF